MPKRNVFISFHHHSDQAAVTKFASDFSGSLDVFTDRSLARAANSEDVTYLNQVCRDAITGTSVTIVMIGKSTGKRKFVDWEIHDTLEKKHGLLAISVPGLPDADASLPDRLADNLPSGSGYAKWYRYPRSGVELQRIIEEAYSADARLINNERTRRRINSA